MSIVINIELMAALPRPTGKRIFEYELSKDGNSIRELLSKLDFSEEDQRYLIVMVNGKQQSSKDVSLKDGDEVFITTLIGGG